MADIPYSELRSLPPGGGNNPVLNAIDAARTAVCSVYNSAPGQLVARNGLPDPSGIGRASRMLFDNMCADKGLPPAPTVPFPGGQCNKDYLVRVSRLNQDAPPGDIVEYTRRGPIGGIVAGKEPGGGAAWGFNYGSGATAGFQAVLGYGGPGAYQPLDRLQVQILSVTPIVGLDNCGSPQPQFPPKEAPGSDFDKPITYPGPGGPITEPFKFPPTEWKLPDLDIPFKPEITIQIGEVNIVFDMSGASLFPIDLDVDVSLGGKGGTGGNNPLPPKKPVPPLDGTAIADRFDRIEDLLKDLEECACGDYSGTLVPSTGATLSSQCLGLSVDRNRFVAINVIQAPSNAGTYSGGSAPDVWQAGWAWFKAGDFLFERQPIDALGKVFRNPGGATAFCYTLKQGYNGFPITLDTPIT